MKRFSLMSLLFVTASLAVTMAAIRTLGVVSTMLLAAGALMITRRKQKQVLWAGVFLLWCGTVDLQLLESRCDPCGTSNAGVSIRVLSVPIASRHATCEHDTQIRQEIVLRGFVLPTKWQTTHGTRNLARRLK